MYFNFGSKIYKLFVFSCFGFISLSPTWLIAQPISFGFKGGIVFSNFAQADEDILVSSLEPEGDFDTSTGEIYTVFFNGNIEDAPLSFQLEVGFKRMGSEFQIDIESSEFRTVDFDQTYLSLAVMPKLDLSPNSKLKPFFMFGPFADISLESKFIFSANTGFLGEKINGRTNNFSFGAQGIAGTELDLDVAIISFNAQYGTTFTNIFNEEITISNQPENIPVGVEDAKHQFFSFMVGFHIPFQH